MRPAPRAFRSARGSLLRSSQGARADLGEVEVPEEPEEARRVAHDVAQSLASPAAAVKGQLLSLAAGLGLAPSRAVLVQPLDDAVAVVVERQAQREDGGQERD